MEADDLLWQQLKGKEEEDRVLIISGMTDENVHNCHEPMQPKPRL